MRKMQVAGGLALSVVAAALFACGSARQACADGYDYGYGPVYGSPVVSGTCPNGQCSGTSYSPVYSTGYPVYYSTQTCPNGSCGLGGSCLSGTCGICPNGTCGTCPNGLCGVNGSCSGGQCSGGRCSGGCCSDGRCTSGSCRSGRCGTCPSGDCERGNCNGNCPNGQCTTRYRGVGTVDPLTLPSRYDRPSSYDRSSTYDRPGFGGPDAASYRRDYASDRPRYRDGDYRDGDFRDEPVSRRSWRSERRSAPPRDSDLESPFYN
jgi:hypothetical protein